MIAPPQSATISTPASSYPTAFSPCLLACPIPSLSACWRSRSVACSDCLDRYRSSTASISSMSCGSSRRPVLRMKASIASIVTGFGPLKPAGVRRLSLTHACQTYDRANGNAGHSSSARSSSAMSCRFLRVARSSRLSRRSRRVRPSSSRSSSKLRSAYAVSCPLSAA